MPPPAQSARHMCLSCENSPRRQQQTIARRLAGHAARALAGERAGRQLPAASLLRQCQSLSESSCSCRGRARRTCSSSRRRRVMLTTPIKPRSIYFIASGSSCTSAESIVRGVRFAYLTGRTNTQYKSCPVRAKRCAARCGSARARVPNQIYHWRRSIVTVPGHAHLPVHCDCNHCVYRGAHGDSLQIGDCFAHEQAQYVSYLTSGVCNRGARICLRRRAPAAGESRTRESRRRGPAQCLYDD